MSCSHVKIRFLSIVVQVVVRDNYEELGTYWYTSNTLNCSKVGRGITFKLSQYRGTIGP